MKFSCDKLSSQLIDGKRFGLKLSVGVLLVVNGCRSAPTVDDQLSPFRVSASTNSVAGLDHDTVTSNVPSPSHPKLLEHETRQPSLVKKRPHLEKPISGKKKTTDENIARQCHEAISRWLNPWNEIFAATNPEIRKTLPNRTAAVLSGRKPLSCLTETDRRDAADSINQIVNQHDYSVALLAPFSGPNGTIGPEILAGINHALQKVPVEQRQVQHRDTEEWQNAGAMRHLKQKTIELVLDAQIGDLMLKGRSSILIAAGNSTIETHLSRRARELGFPLLIIGQNSQLLLSDTTTFRIAPGTDSLARSLAEAARIRGFKRVAIFRPADGRSDALIEAFTKELAKQQGAIAFQGSYASGQFEAMDALVQQALVIDIVTRRQEYENLLIESKRTAEAKGEIFQPKQVFLPPKIEFDAIFIPDDFRATRHFAKILRYHNVKKMALLGHQGWRSPALLSPPEPMLDGSLFVDYIGNYNQLPPELGATALVDQENSWFIRSEYATSLDLQLMGYRAGLTMYHLIAEGQKNTIGMSKRRMLADWLKMAPNQNRGYFASPTHFDRNHQVYWPTFIFAVHEGALQMADGPFISKAEKPQPAKVSKSATSPTF